MMPEEPSKNDSKEAPKLKLDLRKDAAEETSPETAESVEPADLTELPPPPEEKRPLALKLKLDSPAPHKKEVKKAEPVSKAVEEPAPVEETQEEESDPVLRELLRRARELSNSELFKEYSSKGKEEASTKPAAEKPPLKQEKKAPEVKEPEKAEEKPEPKAEAKVEPLQEAPKGIALQLKAVEPSKEAKTKVEIQPEPVVPQKTVKPTEEPVRAAKAKKTEAKKEKAEKKSAKTPNPEKVNAPIIEEKVEEAEEAPAVAAPQISAPIAEGPQAAKEQTIHYYDDSELRDKSQIKALLMGGAVLLALMAVVVILIYAAYLLYGYAQPKTVSTPEPARNPIQQVDTSVAELNTVMDAENAKTATQEPQQSAAQATAAAAPVNADVEGYLKTLSADSVFYSNTTPVVVIAHVRYERGDLVSQEYQLRFVGTNEQKKQLVFKDNQGNTYKIPAGN
ncbi:MAG: hypothetical protein JW739_02905 [Opitutales bacterium]|nr:hypothetical protein [Opitutales bacterium]